MPKPEEYENTAFPVCPYCGWENEDDYWELDDGDECECDACDKRFRVYIERKYTTERIDS